MKIVFQNIITLLFFVVYNYLCLANANVFSVGVFFNEPNKQAKTALESRIHINNVYEARLLPGMAGFNANIEIISKTNTLSITKTICNLFEQNEKLVGIIGPESLTPSNLIQSISKYYELPNLLYNWRPSFTDSIRNTTLNFYPDAKLLAAGLATIVDNLQWKSFIILHENDEGLIRLQDVLKLQKYDSNNKRNMITVKQLGLGPDYRPILKEIKNSTVTQIILDCETDKIITILQQAKEIKLLDIFYSYFLTSFDAHTVDLSVLNTNANITSIRMFNNTSEEYKETLDNWLEKDRTLDLSMIKTETILMNDAITALIKVVNQLQITKHFEFGLSSMKCKEKMIFKNGYGIISYMKIVDLSNLLTAPIGFDEYGNRVNFTLYLVEGTRGRVIANWLSPSNTFVLNNTDQSNKASILKHLQQETVIVSSRIGGAYLRNRVPKEGEVLKGNDRYEGYSMDLIQRISEILNFTFEFRLTEDGKYGDKKTGKWNGLIKDLLERKAHLAICDLTITHDRRAAVDFSMPFMSLGIAILHKQPDAKDVNMFAFLDPFSVEVWIYTATLFLTVSIVLYFIARMAPGDWENPHPCDQHPEELENIWDLKNCFWLTMGSIMTQGCDILPKGISSRMASSMWWFFSLIMTSSYTANLAAFLTTERMELEIDGAEALAKQTKIKYGTLEGGSTQAFFQNSNFSTYQRMWTNMVSSKPSVFEKNNDDGVKRVQTTKNGLYAFLMESSSLEYEIETKCDLKQVGSLLDHKSYGIAMPMNAPYRSAIDEAILYLQEKLELEKLKTKWWKEKRDQPSCDKGSSEGTSSELALDNVGGVFLVLGIGIGIAFLIAIVEFLWNVHSVSVEEHISYWSALKLELIFASKVWVTKKRVKPQPSESSSSSSNSKDDRKSVAKSILHGAGSFLNVNLGNIGWKNPSPDRIN